MSMVIGFLLDLIFGDPKRLPHPIVLIGQGISLGEKILRPRFPKTKRGEQVGGGVLVFFVLSLSFLIPLYLLFFAYNVHFIVGMVVETFMCFQILATKSLKQASQNVYKALREEGLNAGRRKLSMIVGRETENLNRQEVLKATVETVAENTTDGVVAPLFFMAIGGAPLGFFYKAANTLDSMIGYKNENYVNFGTVGAKVDDVLNFIPARLTALMMVMVSGLLRYDFSGGWKIFKRDRYCHTSPNAGQTESVCAGALGIQLGGDSFYFGKRYKKKTIGDKRREIEAEDILKTNRLLVGTGILAMIFFSIPTLVRFII